MIDPYRTSPRTDSITDADRYPVRIPVFVDESVPWCDLEVMP